LALFTNYLQVHTYYHFSRFGSLESIQDKMRAAPETALKTPVACQGVRGYIYGYRYGLNVECFGKRVCLCTLLRGQKMEWSGVLIKCWH